MREGGREGGREGERKAIVRWNARVKNTGRTEASEGWWRPGRKRSRGKREGWGGGGRREEGKENVCELFFLKKDKRMEILGKETKKQKQDTAAATSMNPGCFNWVEVERWITRSNET